MKRREMLKGGLAAAAAGLIPLAGGCTPAVPGATAAPAPGVGGSDRTPVGRARNVIFFAYDGFTYEDLATARYYAARHQDGRTLTLERLMRRGSTGSMLPHSLTAVVTDSAAASTAWSTGRKVVNGAVTMFPDGRPLTHVLELARQSARATGLITTTRLTHATPACWAAKVPDRGMEDEIAAQYLDFAPEVLLGGGSRFFDAATRRDRRDLFAAFRSRGYGVLRTADDLRGTNASRLLGTFATDHLPYEIDRRFQDVPSPTLAEMTRKGLEVLSGSRNGFVVQVEAGRIDHANHGNDPGGALWDILAADEALQVILDFVDRNPDTLLILASDHGTGSGAVFGTGANYLRSSPAFDRIARYRASYEHVLHVLGENPPADRIVSATREFFGVSLSREQARQVSEALERRLRPGHPLAHRSNPSNAIHWLLTVGNEAEPEALNLNYATGAHTAGPVPVAVYGAGTTAAGLGVVDNTELFGWMTHALGIRFENPRMTEAEALRLAAEAAEERYAFAAD
jgi:alkaline phosphatase